ncbi:DUF6894 family protein [Sphingopyxis sp. MSC1_008]|jgi:hypothetical protein
MALYYFHFSDGSTLSRDDCGVECANAEDAYLQAFTTTQEMWSELLVKRKDPSKCAFEITDEAGRLLFQLPFAEAVEACRGNSLPVAVPENSALFYYDTHRRATVAQAELRAGFAEVQQSLSESHHLLRRLADFERPAPRGTV